MRAIVGRACSGSADRGWSEHVSRQPDTGTHRHQSQGEEKHDQDRQQCGSKEGQGSRAGGGILLIPAPKQQHAEHQNSKPAPAGQLLMQQKPEVLGNGRI